ARSWLTSNTVPAYSASCSCNRSRVSRSRSLVGSSSTSRLDGRAKPQARGEPGPLAARQYADRGASLLGAEQEVLHVADHIAAFAAYRHCIAAAAGHRLRQSPLGVKALPPLIERDRRQVGAEPDRTRIRGEGAGQQIE